MLQSRESGSAQSAGPSRSARIDSRGAFAKRGLDIVVAGLALIAATPILLLAAAASRHAMGPGVLFRQERPGRNGVGFTLYKLRTMTDAVNGEGPPLTEFARVTPLGRILRTTSIDELPQLWNVLKGDMSLVGPRPLLTRYLDRYNAEQRRRHDVRPGITGWAQVHRRTAVTWEERLRLDTWYVDNRTFRLDLAILIRTVGDLFSSGGNPAMDTLSRTAANELEFRGDDGRAGQSSGRRDGNVNP